MLYFAELKKDEKITEKLKFTPIVTEFEADYQYVTNVGKKFLFRTNINAQNYKIIVVDIDNYAKSNWTDLIPEHRKDVLEWAQVINNDMLVVCYLHDVKVRARKDCFNACY